jgi:nucleoporin NDC1
MAQAAKMKRISLTINKATAFWELVLITTRFPERRETIYSELDRANGSTWTQIQTLCMAEITSIKARIDKYNSPVAPSTTTPPPASQVPGRKPITAPLKTDPIFAKAPPPATELRKAATYIGDVARRHGNTPGAQPLREALEYGSQKLLTDGQRSQIAPEHIQQTANGLLVQVVHSPVGYIFRQSFSRRASSVIFGGAIVEGSEYSTASVTVSAIDALTQLLVQSLKEDKYAQVSKSVPTIIRAYAEAIHATELFLKDMVPHWSDVKFQKPKRGKVEDVNVLLEALREGLEDIFGAFGEYLEGMGMGAQEIVGFKGLCAWRPALDESKKGKERILS